MIFGAAVVIVAIYVLAVLATIRFAPSISLDEEAGQSFNPYAADPGEEYPNGEEAQRR